jgi:hypothetical protein
MRGARRSPGSFKLSNSGFEFIQSGCIGSVLGENRRDRAAEGFALLDVGEGAVDELLELREATAESLRGFRKRHGTEFIEVDHREAPSSWSD